MQNINEIRAEAKEEIISILKMCDCYTYTDEGIDKWLDKWEEACAPQIEKIAEKSPYYDGKCKIVFPAEYPRGFNEYGIASFCAWLRSAIIESIEPVRIDGFTYQDILKRQGVIGAVRNMLHNKNAIRELIEDKDSFDSLMEEYDRISETSYKINEIYDKFYYSRDVYQIGDDYYSKSDLENYGYHKAIRLANTLVDRNFRVQFLTESLASMLSVNFPNCRFAEGQKLSRAVNNIAKKYGISKHPDWNREFAKYADSINPLTVTKWTVISWHPVDYLTFCFGNCWSTCSNIDKHNNRGIKISASKSSVTSYVDENYVFRGEHASACLSYMFDKTSFIYYTVDHDYEGKNYEMQDKESRIVFSLNEDMDTLLQSRLYPQCNDDNPDDTLYRIPREIVQKVIADALEVPNLWKMKKGSYICREYGESVGVHYPDYTDERNKNCNISWRGDYPRIIEIGHDAICPKCGCTHTKTYSLNCYDCDPEC